MSYINDALKKAQRERDGRFERFGGIVDSAPAGRRQPRKRRVVLAAAIALVVLVPAGLLMALYARQQPSGAELGAPPPVAAGLPVGQTAGTAVSGAVIPAPEPAAEIAALPQPGKGAATAESPAKAATAPREADARYREALSAQRRGDLREAESLYGKALLLDPTHVRAVNNVGVLYMGQKKRDQAIAMFSRAIALKKDYVDPYYNMACLYGQAGQIDESIRYLKEAMTIDGDVKNWVEKDADMKPVVASPAFRKFMEGQKN